MPIRQTSSLRLLCVAALLLLASVGAAQAARVAIGVNIGLPYYGAHVGYGYGPGYYGHGRGYGYGRPYYGGFYGYGGWAAPVILAPPLVYGAPPAPLVIERPAAPPAPARPDPVIYPRNGQSGQQTEYDRQECNRWATTQPAAVADASVFQRAVEACMDGRGYSMR